MAKTVQLTQEEIAALIEEKTEEKNRELLALKFEKQYRALLAKAQKAGLHTGGLYACLNFTDRKIFW